MSTADIFVLGLDDGNLRTLEQIPDAQRFRYHQLLGIEETQEGEIPIEDLLHKAQETLKGFDGEIAAVVGYWDFPSRAR